jgi:hypothetical protein
MRRGTLLTGLIIVLIIAFAVYEKTKPNDSNVSEELAKCIGENSVLYSQVTCSHCVAQKRMFGENVKHLNIFECGSDNWKTCSEIGITGTPTWVINQRHYSGVRSVESIQQLTGC